MAADAWSQVLQGPGCLLFFMKEVDLLRGSDQDVADDDFWDALIKEMGSGEFEVLVIAPRATHILEPGLVFFLVLGQFGMLCILGAFHGWRGKIERM